MTISEFSVQILLVSRHESYSLLLRYENLVPGPKSGVPYTIIDYKILLLASLSIFRMKV